jgi:hypothetical protein
MKKSKAEKKVNRIARKLNKELSKDVFGNRFWVRQYQKAKHYDMSWFLYELIDNEQPGRNYLIPGWLNEFDAKRRIYAEMNEFIVQSNFWSQYHGNDSYDSKNDKYFQNILD